MAIVVDQFIVVDQRPLNVKGLIAAALSERLAGRIGMSVCSGHDRPRWLLEVKLETNAERVRLRTDEIVRSDRSVADGTRISPGVDVVEDALAIRIHVPVQSGRHVLHHATLDLLVGNVKV